MPYSSKIQWISISEPFAHGASFALVELTAREELSFGSTEPEQNSYWFTSDHLGSSAFVTDGSGVAIHVWLGFFLSTPWQATFQVKAHICMHITIR